jgi:hypothetical protein
MDGEYGESEMAIAVRMTVGEAVKGERAKAPSDLGSSDDAWTADAAAMVMLRQMSFPVYWPVGDIRTFIHSSGEGEGERESEGALSLVRGPGSRWQRAVMGDFPVRPRSIFSSRWVWLIR